MLLVLLLYCCAAAGTAVAAATTGGSAGAGPSMAEIGRGGVWVRKDRDRIEGHLPILFLAVISGGLQSRAP